MGIFSKKKTTVETIKQTVVQSKLIKLSYIQTLAIDGGITDVKSLAGETQATTEEIKGNPSEKKNTVTKINDKLKNPIVSLYTGLNSAIVGNFVNALFGKKVSRDVTTTVKDSGWSISKTWNQPQFDIIRYAIGIKELNISQFTYEQISEIVSQPWASPKEIVKISLYVDQFIPKEFAPDTYIEYYVKPDEEESNWVRINPIGLPTVFLTDGTIVPRILTYNTERPISARLEESYILTTKPVKSVRFRAVIKRPSTINVPGVSADAYTPILKSYKLIMTPKGGL